MSWNWLMSVYVCIFFFKQMAAYELRISDWSSDVCSSDLFEQQRRRFGDAVERGARGELARVGQRGLVHIVAFAGKRAAGERARKSVVLGKSVSVRVDLGGRRIIKKNKLNQSISSHKNKIY